jgi:hypothetical protein
MAEVPHARNEDHPATEYFQFELKREQKAGLNSGGETDANPGFSPISRWISAAFDYDDFASNPSLTGYEAKVQVPRDSMVLRVVARVDETFDNVSTPIIGDDADPNGWNEDAGLGSTGFKYDPDAAFGPDGGTGGKYYEDGDTIDVQTQNGTAPTQGKGILFIEVISYHEDAEAEW